MNYKKVFADGNVILYYFLKGRPFSEYSEKAIDYLVENDITLLTICDLITTVYYVLSKKDKYKRFYKKFYIEIGMSNITENKLIEQAALD